MKSLLKLAVVAGLALTAATTAHAQTSNLLGSFDVRAGLFDPGSGGARNISPDTQFALGADYTLPGIASGPRTTIYGDYQSGGKNGGHIETYGVGALAKFSPPLVGSITHVTPYGGVGVGIYRVNVSVISSSGTDTSLGGKLIAGLNFGKYFLEANYQVLASEKGINPSGVGLQLGFTFL